MALLRVAPGAFVLKAALNLGNSLLSRHKSKKQYVLLMILKHLSSERRSQATHTIQSLTGWLMYLFPRSLARSLSLSLSLCICLLSTDDESKQKTLVSRMDVADAARFASFIGSLSLAAPVVERFVFHILMRVGGGSVDTPNMRSKSVYLRAVLSSLIGGASAGSALLLDDVNRRQAIALYALVNALDAVFRLVLIRRWVPVLPSVSDARRLSYVYVFLMCCVASWTLFAHGYHYESFFRPYQYFLAKYGNVSVVCADRSTADAEAPVRNRWSIHSPADSVVLVVIAPLPLCVNIGALVAVR
jgi:hypothetical protein